MRPHPGGYRCSVSSARDLLAALLLAAAVLLGVLWLPGVWMDHHVVDQDGFLEITQPLADDPAAQKQLSDAAVEQILDDDRIPDWAADTVSPMLQEQAPKLTGSELYAQIWDRTMVDLHEALFTPGQQDLDVDLVPVIDELLGSVEEKLPVELPRPENASFTLATIPDIPLLNRLAAVSPWFSWAGPVAGVLVLLALLLAGHRRTFLALAGFGGILAGGAVCLLAGTIRSLVPDAIDQADFLGPIVTALEADFHSALLPQGVIMLGASALVAAVGLVLVGLHRR